jgi:predicted MPP superfamily phosphohydrolase
MTHDSLPKSQAAGLSRHGPTYLHVTRGLGCSKYNLRFWCPAEMTVIRLVPA